MPPAVETSMQSHDECQTERTPRQHDCHTELRPNERQRSGNAEWRKDLGQLSRVAEDRGEWRNFVAALCARRHNGQ